MSSHNTTISDALIFLGGMLGLFVIALFLLAWFVFLPVIGLLWCVGQLI